MIVVVFNFIFLVGRHCALLSSGIAVCNGDN
jgi:hypothetical protein